MISRELRPFYDLTISDPLFAAEGLDLDNALNAIEAIEVTTQKLQEFWQKSHRGFCFWYPFSETLHPFRFLRKFLECEREIRHFLANPSLENAEKLLHLYNKTGDALIADLDAYSGALKALLKMEGIEFESSIFYFHSNAVTVKEFISSIEMINENALMLRSEVRQREKILKNAEVREVARFSDRDNYMTALKDSGPGLSQEYLYMQKLEEENAPPILERYGPIYYELPHLDGNPRVHRFQAYVMKGPYPGVKYLSISLTDQRYFLKLQDTPKEVSEKQSHFDNRNKVIYEPLMKRGINYWHQSATSFYSVMDLGYYSDLATIVDSKWRRPFLDARQLLIQKSSLFDLILWNGWTHERIYLQMTGVQAGVNKLSSPLYSFVARSYPSLYYLPFNKSVWRLEKPLHFLGSRFGKGGVYSTYEDLKSELSREMLEKIFQGRILRKKEWENHE